MGRNKKEVKKMRQSITIDNNLIDIVKEKHINLSSLLNKLLTEYFNDEKKM
jgi:rRNA-processing protein FCF1